METNLLWFWRAQKDQSSLPLRYGVLMTKTYAYSWRAAIARWMFVFEIGSILSISQSAVFIDTLSGAIDVLTVDSYFILVQLPDRDGYERR